MVEGCNTHEVAADSGGVCEGEADGLLRVDDEDSTDGEREALRILVRRVLVVEHVVQRRDLAIAVRDLQLKSPVSPFVHQKTTTTHDGELHIRRARGLAAVLVDVLDPVVVLLQVVRGDANDLYVALLEVLRAARHLAELGRAHGREVARVGEENGLRVRGHISKSSSKIAKGDAPKSRRSSRGT